MCKHTYLPKCKHVALSINNTVHQEFKPAPLAKTSLLLDLLSLLLPLSLLISCYLDTVCLELLGPIALPWWPCPFCRFPTASWLSCPDIPHCPPACVPWPTLRWCPTRLSVCVCLRAFVCSLPPPTSSVWTTNKPTTSLYKQFNNCWRIHGLSA